MMAVVSPRRSITPSMEPDVRGIPRDPLYFHYEVNLVDVDGTHVVTEAKSDDLGLLTRVVVNQFLFLNAHSQLVYISKSRI